MTTATADAMVTIPTGRYQLDTVHSRLGFAIRHMVTSVHGHFAAFTGHIDIPATAPEQAVAELDIDPASIETSNPDRDSHLRSPRVGWPEGVSPSGSHRSRRDSLPSPGSCHPAHQAVVTQRQCRKMRGYPEVISANFRRAARVLSYRRYLLRIQRTR